MAMAASLPWSTTVFGIFTVLWFICLIYAADGQQFAETLRRPECFLPIAIFALAVAGMFWSDAPWAARVHIAGTMVKLLAVPPLIYQFERSERSAAVFLVFLASCTVLLALSWINWLEPRTILFKAIIPGVPVKNWITQGVEFVLCFFGSLALAIIKWRNDRHYTSLGFVLIALCFLLNMIFVAAASRTSLVSLPLLMVVATFRYLGWRRAVPLYGVIVVVICATWFASPALRGRLESIHDQYAQYADHGKITSVGLRLEYWSKALQFIRTAPFAGHGTGSIRGLFARDAIGKTIVADQIVANPHNQTLYFAIEWGVIGIILLWAMWIAHFLMFTEIRWISWLGIIVVSQNIFDSLFNSHISDYVEGWIYVMGVGVAAGMISRSRKPASPAVIPI
ncbi:MAG: O-antigen ligase family protein [Rhizobiales bacterium]|nr:O-antigen ligase family protein [Hyphomicrobiales bacterium]